MKNQVQPELPPDIPTQPFGFIYLGIRTQVQSLGRRKGDKYAAGAEFAYYVSGQGWKIVKRGILPVGHWHIAAPKNCAYHKAQRWSEVQKQVPTVPFVNTSYHHGIKSLPEQVREIREKIKELRKSAALSMHNQKYLSLGTVKAIESLCFSDTFMRDKRKRYISEEARCQGFKVAETDKDLIITL